MTHAVVPITTDDPNLEPEDGPTQSDVLLQAIVIVARKEPPNKAALRNLIAKFSCEYGLDF